MFACAFVSEASGEGTIFCRAMAAVPLAEQLAWQFLSSFLGAQGTLLFSPLLGVRTEGK